MCLPVYQCAWLSVHLWAVVRLVQWTIGPRCGLVLLLLTLGEAACVNPRNMAIEFLLSFQNLHVLSPSFLLWIDQGRVVGAATLLKPLSTSVGMRVLGRCICCLCYICVLFLLPGADCFWCSGFVHLFALSPDGGQVANTAETEAACFTDGVSCPPVSQWEGDAGHQRFKCRKKSNCIAA